MSASSAGSNGGSSDTQRELDRQKRNREAEAAARERARQQANVEIGLGTSSKNVTDGTLSDPREKKDPTAESNLDNLKFDEVSPLVPGSSIINAIGQKSLDKNVDFFKNDSRTNKARIAYGVTDTGYKKYMKDRSSGKIDAAGNVNPGYGRDRDNNVQTQKVTAGGQTILTEQKTPAETKVEKEEKKEYDARQTKKRGRRKTLLTSSRGVTTTSSDYSLGKPTLLGMV